MVLANQIAGFHDQQYLKKKLVNFLFWFLVWVNTSKRYDEIETKQFGSALSKVHKLIQNGDFIILRKVFSVV